MLRSPEVRAPRGVQNSSHPCSADGGPGGGCGNRIDRVGTGHSLLSSGHLVTVWNRTRLWAEPLEAEGAELAPSAAEAVQEASVVITMLPDAESTARMMADALTKFRPGAVWVQMGTVGMSGIQDLAAMAAAAGLAFVDAPVSGSREPAQAGELLILASGPASIRAEVQPVFDAVGRATIWAGEGAGPATALKLVVNDWLINLLGCLGEALAGSLGVDPSASWRRSRAGPWPLRSRRPRQFRWWTRTSRPAFPSIWPRRTLSWSSRLLRSTEWT